MYSFGGVLVGGVADDFQQKAGGKISDAPVYQICIQLGLERTISFMFIHSKICIKGQKEI